MEEKKSNKKIIYIVTGVITILAIAAIIISLLLLSRTHRLIKVIETEGKVVVEREKEGILDAFIEMILKSGDTVTTAKESRLYMQLDGDKYVELMPESVMHIVATGDVEKNNTRTRIILDKGSVINEIQTHLGDDEGFDVETQSVCLGVRGTKFEVKASQNDDVKETYIEVLDGTVEAYREGEADTVKIEAGYHATIKETDNLKDIVIEENLPYFDFEVNVFDIKILGKSIEELATDDTLFESIREQYSINEYKEVNVNGKTFDKYISTDGKWEINYNYPHNSFGCVDGVYHYFILSKELKVNSLYIYGDTTRYESIANTAGHIVPTLFSYELSFEDVKEIMCVDELMELLRQGNRYFKCNWSDDTYIFFGKKDGDTEGYLFMNTRTHEIFSFSSENDDTFPYYDYRWSLERLNDEESAIEYMKMLEEADY